MTKIQHLQWKWVALILASVLISFFVAKQIDLQFSIAPDTIFIKTEPTKPSSLVKAKPEQILAWREDQNIKKDPEQIAFFRNQLERKLKPILKDDTDYNAIWASCKNKNCYTLYMGQLLLLKPYAKDQKTFNSQICQVFSNIEQKPTFGYVPEYTPDIHRNTCKLTNKEDLNSTQELFHLFFWFAFLACLIATLGLGSLFLLFIDKKRDKSLPLLIFNS